MSSNSSQHSNYGSNVLAVLAVPEMEPLPPGVIWLPGKNAFQVYHGRDYLGFFSVGSSGRRTALAAALKAKAAASGKGVQELLAAARARSRSSVNARKIEPLIHRPHN